MADERQNERRYLRDACLSAQDKFKKYPDYFPIGYENNNPALPGLCL